ncbi:hypothetical protein Gotur_010176, partial [Gossypium turneri]
RAKIGRESRLSNRGLYPDELGVDTKIKKSDLFFINQGVNKEIKQENFSSFQLNMQ